jgi:pyrroline-5-carboxylate reductase
MATFGFIGVGNMGGALAKGVARSVDPKNIILSNKTAAKAEALASQLGCVADTVEQVAAKCDYIFLGVKPHMMEGLLSSLSSIFAARKDSFVLVSMAAGLTIGDIQRMAGKAYPVIRIMPNVPVAIGEGVTLYDYSENVSPEAVSQFCDAMAGTGMVSYLQESLIDAGSALSGSGPAFVSMFIEALADGALMCGLPRQLALEYACQTLIGTSKMLLETGMHPGQMKDSICSPGGSTIAGVAALEGGAFRATAMDAVLAAFDRTKELGQ